MQSKSNIDMDSSLGQIHVNTHFKSTPKIQNAKVTHYEICHEIQIHSREQVSFSTYIVLSNVIHQTYEYMYRVYTVCFNCFRAVLVRVNIFFKYSYTEHTFFHKYGRKAKSNLILIFIQCSLSLVSVPSKM